jgi:hypothetical protein
MQMEGTVVWFETKGIVVWFETRKNMTSQCPTYVTVPA